jgi:transposase
MNAPHKPVPDSLVACQDYARALLQELSSLSRRAAQLQAELATERERWARLKAEIEDAQRQGFTVDALSFMRGIERTVPSVPVLMVEG